MKIVHDMTLHVVDVNYNNLLSHDCHRKYNEISIKIRSIKLFCFNKLILFKTSDLCNVAL